MAVELPDVGEAARKLLTGHHPFVYDACPAVMNDQKGFLGVSRGVYWKVWFDIDTRSKALFTSFSKRKALARFRDLRSQYGQVER